MKAYAKVIADSITPTGRRLTTFEVCFWRFVLAEFNTHRIFSRNSASSRAIPVVKMLARFLEEPALPHEWASEQKGMQGGPPLTDQDLADALALFNAWHDDTATLVGDYIAIHPISEEGQVRLHKSLLNRLLEPMQWHTAVVSATGWENFFRQRCSPMAQPEIRVPAEMMKEAYRRSVPQLLKPGEYHLPYITQEDRSEVPATVRADQDRLLVPISSARSARVSYLTQDGTRDHAEDHVLYKRLTDNEPMHASPLEHVATPAPWNEHQVHLVLDDEGLVQLVPLPGLWGGKPAKTLTLPVVGNFLGWQQHRMEVEMTRSYEFYG